MTEDVYVCRCICTRPFTTTCPTLTECPRCAARQLLARPVADTMTATERLLFKRLLFEVQGNDDTYEEAEFAAEFNELGTISLPEENDAAVTALLTGQLPPRRPNNSWLEVAIFLMICVVAWLLWLTGGS